MQFGCGFHFIFKRIGDECRPENSGKTTEKVEEGGFAFGNQIPLNHSWKTSLSAPKLFMAKGSE